MPSNYKNSVFSFGKKYRFILFLNIIASFTLFCTGKKNNDKKIPPIYLNHISIVMDSLTYSDIYNSDFLKNEFCAFHAGTVTAADSQSWTGAYIFGEKTYIEFFKSADQNSVRLTGIGFGVDIIGGTATLYNYINRQMPNKAEKIVRNKMINNREIPWFTFLFLSSKDTNRSLRTWVMEYDLDFMKFKYPHKHPDSLTISRKCSLSNVYRTDLLLKDIIAIEIVLNNAELKQLTNELQLYGYDIVNKKDELIAVGPDMRIKIIMGAQSNVSITKIIFSLTKAIDRQMVFRFGRSSSLLLNINKTAVWRFND